MKHITLALAFLSIFACAPTEQAVEIPQEEATPVVTVEVEPEMTEMDIHQARLMVQKADYEAYEQLSEEEKQRNEEILEILLADRLAAITAGLPEWVANRVLEFEGSDLDNYSAYRQSVAWGTGMYNNRSFHWFGRTNSDGWLQMDMSIAISEEDLNQIMGRRPGDLEGADMYSSILVTYPEDNYFLGGESTGTHIGFTGGASWPDEFCTKPDYDRCDIAGAFEEYLLLEANKALPGRLTFELVGRFLPQ